MYGTQIDNREIVKKPPDTSSNQRFRVLEEQVLQPHDHLRWRVQQACGLHNLHGSSGIVSMLKEYTNLATKPEITDLETERLYQIYEASESRPELDEWIARIDEATEKFTIGEDLSKSDKKYISLITLEEYLYRLRQIEPEEMTLEQFRELVLRLDLSADLINSHIQFAKTQHFRELIHSSRYTSICVISWKPGDHVPPHEHDDSLSVIRVCKGQLAHRKWHRVDKGGYMGHTKGLLDLVPEDEYISIDNLEKHELSNQSQEKLITLHFRYYKHFDQRNELMIEGREKDQKD
jgi:predicted metal-dependent enzyme (double-stranded beta helix superfamily)